MIKENSYVHGTAARKLEYDVYKENKVLNQKRKQRNNNKLKYKVVFMLFVVFALGCFATFRYAQITEMNYEINKQMGVFAEIEKENIRVQTEITSTLNLQEIREVAEKKLGMQKPEEYQITYISVPKSDYTVVSETVKNEIDKKDIMSYILGKFQSFVSFLS